MAQFTGMNVDSVRQLATQMRNSADQIEQAQQQLTSQLKSAEWVGTDKDRFEADWDGNIVGQLRNICTALQDTAQTADRNAADQETTSAS